MLKSLHSHQNIMLGKFLKKKTLDLGTIISMVELATSKPSGVDLDLYSEMEENHYPVIKAEIHFQGRHISTRCVAVDRSRLMEMDHVKLCASILSDCIFAAYQENGIDFEDNGGIRCFGKSHIYRDYSHRVVLLLGANMDILEREGETFMAPLGRRW